MDVVRRLSSAFVALFFSLAALPASAGLIYQSDGVLDSITGLVWQSTGLTRGLPSGPIPDDRIVRDGWRLATAADVEALFVGNFPALGPALNTGLPVTIDPAVRALAVALGGDATDLVITVAGIELLRWPMVSLLGWVAVPTWEYQRFSIGYAVYLDTFPDEHPDSVFASSSQFVGSYRQLAAPGSGTTCAIGTGCTGDVGQDGYFLVRAASVPVPASALLVLTAFAALWTSRRGGFLRNSR